MAVDKRKIGLDDYLCSHSVKELLMLSAEPIETAPDLIMLVQELWAESDSTQIEYVLKGVAELESEIEAERMVKEIHTRTNIRIALLREQVVFFRTQSPQDRPQAPVEVAEADRDEAFALLRNPGLLLEFVADMEKLGCVGQKSEKICLKLAAASGRLSEEPVNVMIKGESAAGKNYLLHSVLETEPPDDVIEVTRITGKALQYFPGSLKHKIVSIAEVPGGEDADYSIRTFQSEKMIRILVPEKDELGRLETRERLVEGPAVFFQTTTKAHLHPENETRAFDLFIDETEEQTRRIFEAQDRRYSDPMPVEERDRILRKWQNAARLIAPMPVLIPFADKIRFPTKPLRVRRDRPRLLALVQASALLHQQQREIIERNGQLFLVAEVDDYALARELAIALLQSVLSGATPKCTALVKWAQTQGERRWSKKHIDQAMDWSRKTTLKHLAEAVGLGCLGMDGNQVKTSKDFWFVKGVEGPLFELPTPDHLLGSCTSTTPRS